MPPDPSPACDKIAVASLPDPDSRLSSGVFIDIPGCTFIFAAPRRQVGAVREPALRLPGPHQPVGEKHLLSGRSFIKIAFLLPQMSEK